MSTTIEPQGQTKPPRRRRMLSPTGVFLLAPLVLLAVWLAFTGVRREMAETRPVQALAPQGGRWVQAADAELFVQEWGDAQAPVVLLVHGVGAWSGTWFGTPQVLAAAGWRVVAVDLPPFGFSRVGAPADYTRVAQAKRLLALIDALGRGPVVLVGHSSGAGPSLEAALQGPSRFKQLVLIDPAVGFGPKGEPPHCNEASVLDALLDQRELRTTLVSGFVTPPWFSRSWLESLVSRKEAITQDRLAVYQLPLTRKGFSEGLGDWAAAFVRSGCDKALSLDPKQLIQWAQGNTPVTLLWGELDRIIPLAQSDALRSMLPQAKLVTVPGVGHIPHIEDPAAFQAALLGVLVR